MDEIDPEMLKALDDVRLSMHFTRLLYEDGTKLEDKEECASD